MPRGWALSDAVEVDCEVRWARKPRLIEAHEQLVLGPQTCWIGDSMRREPAKCDAYETYIDDCAETAGIRRWSPSSGCGQPASRCLPAHRSRRAAMKPMGFARRH